MESKIRILVQNLERHRSVELAHVFPKSYTRFVPDDLEPLAAVAPDEANTKTEQGDITNNQQASDSTTNDNGSTADLVNNGQPKSCDESSEKKPETKEIKDDDNASQKSSESSPKMREERIWFIGLRFSKSESMNVDFSQDTKMFVETSKCKLASVRFIQHILSLVITAATTAKFFMPEMCICIRHVRKKELPHYLPPDENIIIRKSKSNLNKSKSSVEKVRCGS